MIKNLIKKLSAKHRQTILIIACVLFGGATVATFFAKETLTADLFSWFNLLRIAIYAIFLTLLFKIFRGAPKLDPDKKTTGWAKKLIFILPIVAVILALINAAFPEVCAWLVRSPDDLWRPAIFVKSGFQLIACGIFLSFLPRFIKQKKWLNIAIVAILVIVLFVMAGEELSWGQRIFRWETGEFFAEHNIQGETNLHNLSTQLFQNTLYFGGFLLLIVLPFFHEQLKKMFGKFRLLKPLSDFLPETWMLLAFGAGLMFIEPFSSDYGLHWGSICFQTIATLAFLAISAWRLRGSADAKKPNSYFDLSLRAIAGALIVLALSWSFDSLWMQNQGSPTEYLELFLNLGILCWAISVKQRLSPSGSKKKSPAKI